MGNIFLPSIFGKYQRCSQLLIKSCRSWSCKHRHSFHLLLCVAGVHRGCKWNGVNFNVWSFVTQSEKQSFWQRIFSWCKGNIRGEGGMLISPPFWRELQKEASKGVCSLKRNWKTRPCLVSHSVVCFPPFLIINILSNLMIFDDLMYSTGQRGESELDHL